MPALPAIDTTRNNSHRTPVSSRHYALNAGKMHSRVSIRQTHARRTHSYSVPSQTHATHTHDSRNCIQLLSAPHDSAESRSSQHNSLRLACVPQRYNLQQVSWKSVSRTVRLLHSMKGPSPSGIIPSHAQWIRNEFPSVLRQVTAQAQVERAAD